MKILSIFLALVSVFLLFSFSEAQTSSNLAGSDNQFAFDLYSRFASKQGNIFFSPYSLSSALEMTFEGARGETAQQMRAVLHLGADDAARRNEITAFIHQINSSDKTYDLSVANALWANKSFPFKEDYLNLVKNTYIAEARNLDFLSNSESARLTINSWVSEKTNDRIKDLLRPGTITSYTRLVLTNAVYFKARWETPFKKENTKPDTFWLTPGHSVQADTMTLKGDSFNYTDNDQAQVLQFLYQGNDLSMFIILPRSMDLYGLEKTLNPDMLKRWQGEMSSQKVNVFLPKFKFESYFQMNDVLKSLGMKLAFDQGNADFSGMVNPIPGDGFYIGLVVHKAWIDANEEGTEAAAATAVVMSVGAARMIESQPKIFRADHPFIFVIQDTKSGHILFMGRVSDPR